MYAHVVTIKALGDNFLRVGVPCDMVLPSRTPPRYLFSDVCLGFYGELYPSKWPLNIIVLGDIIPTLTREVKVVLHVCANEVTRVLVPVNK